MKLWWTFLSVSDALQGGGLVPRIPRKLSSGEWGITVWEGQGEEGEEERAACKDDQDVRGCRGS